MKIFISLLTNNGVKITSISKLSIYILIWARPLTLGLQLVDAGKAGQFRADFSHKLGLTSCLGPIRICALGPLTLGPTFVAAGYAGSVRADFHHKCDLTSCPSTIKFYNNN